MLVIELDICNLNKTKVFTGFREPFLYNISNSHISDDSAAEMDYRNHGAAVPPVLDPRDSAARFK